MLVATVSILPLVQEHTLKEGTWGGTMTPPGGGTVEITYLVKTVDGELTITLESQMYGAVPATDIRLEPDTLYFSWTPEPRVDCTLRLQEDGSYEGECKDRSGDTGYLTMVPPQS